MTPALICARRISGEGLGGNAEHWECLDGNAEHCCYGEPDHSRKDAHECYCGIRWFGEARVASFAP